MHSGNFHPCDAPLSRMGCYLGWISRGPLLCKTNRRLPVQSRIDGLDVTACESPKSPASPSTETSIWFLSPPVCASPERQPVVKMLLFLAGHDPSSDLILCPGTHPLPSFSLSHLEPSRAAARMLHLHGFTGKDLGHPSKSTRASAWGARPCCRVTTPPRAAPPGGARTMRPWSVTDQIPAGTPWRKRGLKEDTRAHTNPSLGAFHSLPSCWDVSNLPVQCPCCLFSSPLLCYVQARSCPPYGVDLKELFGCILTTFFLSFLSGTELLQAVMNKQSSDQAKPVALSSLSSNKTWIIRYMIKYTFVIIAVFWPLFSSSRT